MEADISCALPLLAISLLVSLLPLCSGSLVGRPLAAIPHFINAARHGAVEESSSAPASGVFLLCKGMETSRVKAKAPMLNLKGPFGWVILSIAKDLA